MRVLIVSFYYSPELGAAPSRITNMAEGLKREGADVEILTCLPNYPKGRIFEGYRGKYHTVETVNGIKAYRYWTYASVSKNALARIFGMTAFSVTLWSFMLHPRKIGKYDVVVVQSPPLMVATSAIMLFKCLFRKKMVLNVSDLWPTSAVELGAVKEGSVIHKLMRWMERFNYRHVDGIQCQSEEIRAYIFKMVPDKRFFLYRNLQLPIEEAAKHFKSKKVFKIAYAGLLGVAQDMLSLIKHINFKSMNAELHIYGGGNQAAQIEEYCKDGETSCFYHGFLDKKEIVNTLKDYHASIVPLTKHIEGAVPSKIYDLIPLGVPVLFCGGGEGAKIVLQHNLGLVSEPSDYDGLKQNIIRMERMTESEYMLLRENILRKSESEFSFYKQMEDYNKYLKKIAGI